MGCFIGISTKRKTVSPHMKNYDNFTCVWDRQPSADMSSAVLSAMNEWQSILFLKCELSQLLLVLVRCLQYIKTK